MPTLKRWSFLSVLTLILYIMRSGTHGSRLLAMAEISVRGVRPSSFLRVEIRDYLLCEGGFSVKAQLTSYARAGFR